MKNIIYFNEAIPDIQDGFSFSQLRDLIDYIHVNQSTDFGSIPDEIPVFDTTFVIRIFHPDSPDTYAVYLFKDHSGHWWPYATLDCLCGIKTITTSIEVHSS